MMVKILKKPMYTVTYYKDEQGLWRWRLEELHTKKRGVVGASSEGFSSKAKAKNNLKRVHFGLAPDKHGVIEIH